MSFWLGSIAQPNGNYRTNPDRKRTFNWLFGDSIWLDYRTNPPIQRSGSRMISIESASVYSDTGGNLVLYSDGKRIWNRNHNVIVNGTGLNGDSSSSQGSLFLPQPGNDSIVFLFTTDRQGLDKGFCYSRIILNGNIDSSKVVEKNTRLLPYSCESISATRHANGLWTWVAVHDKSGKGMNAFLITDAGINLCPVTSEGGFNFIYDIFSCQSKSAFSCDGKLYAISAMSDALVEFMYFNNFSGIFKTTNYSIQAFTPTSINFTNDSRYCYVTERDFDIIKVDVKQFGYNTVINDHNDSFMIIGARFNPHNQLMVNIYDSFFLGRIDDPEKISAKFIRKGLTLKKRCTNELPNFDNGYYHTPGVSFNYRIDCSDNRVYLMGQDTFNANRHTWSVRRLSVSTWTTIGSSRDTCIVFNDTGAFQLQYIASNDLISDTIVKRIDIGKPIQRNFLGKDTGYCMGSFPSILLSVPTGMQCVRWNTDSSGESVTVEKGGRYIATVTTSSFCQMADTISLHEDPVIPVPVITRKGDSLFSSETGARYFWYRNDSLVSNMRDIKVTRTGIYKLMILGKGGCPAESDTVGVYRLSISNLPLAGVSIRPNPACEEIRIEGLDGLNQLVMYITDVQGRVIRRAGQEVEGGYAIKIGDLEVGIYFITLTNYDNTTTIKIIKQ